MDMVHEREVSSEKEVAGDLRRGPWTVEEDLLLGNYIAMHGEGRWNSLARAAGLKRTGKSCRLRWLNYLRPDLRRGNITPQEQLLILELHSRWGNRWSKIAQHLPGRTDNEIKNYWRTRVQKHAKQLKCDVNSQQFKDVMRYLWMPRLIERIHAASLPATAVAACGGVVQPPSTLPDWPADVLVNPGPEVSSTTTAGSSSCTSTDSAAGMKFRSPPVAERAHGHDTSGAATCDTLRHHGLTQQQPQPGPFGETESWPESLSGLEVGSEFGFPDIGLSDFEIYTLCDNTWGAVDDLWYMQGL